MPRTQRRTSESGYYHVMVRGNARQLLFESDACRRFFLDTIQKNLEESSVRVLAWCLMDNHVHLLISDPDGGLSLVMLKILSKYARFYNALGERVGHVFQDRFLSVPIESDRFLLEAARYIHCNPVKDGLCDDPDEYEWSSYSEYMGKPTFTETKTILEMLGGREAFASFHSEIGRYAPRFSKRVSSEDMAALARSVVGINDLHEIKSFSKGKRDALLADLKGAGLSNKQIERLTGIGRGVVQDVKPLS